MKFRFTFLSICFMAASCALFGQVAKDATVALTATVNSSPVGITLNWPNPTASNLLVLRHTKGVPPGVWVQVLNVSNSTQTTLTDNLISTGQTYEYVIQRITTINSFGYAHVAVNAPVVDNRGKVLIIVDSTTADALGVELVRMKNDMRGDGWIATPMKIGPSATVQSVKNMIVAAYNADPSNVKAVFLVGRVPVPYSGDNTGWDGHTDHFGAWPADSYYADVNGIWTDNITNTTPSRAANKNLPGDGKFDQDFIPSAVELQVGRLDFRHLTQATFGASEIELLRRYLDKNHRWRTKQYVVNNKALIDDNFGYFGGEAFAANGFRNANPLVGAANIVEADFFNGTETNSYLMGYGCGGGSYTTVDGVGTSANFGADSVNIVFTNLFGSYFGDWDYETDPLMPSALASRGGILTCGWAGRPHVFQQALASGETIGYCNLETQNAQYDVGFFGSFGESGAHVSLLGDPTLRARIVAPPTGVTTTGGCSSVTLNWTASSDANVSGYHIYRSLSNDGPYTRLTTTVVNGTSYVDASPLVDTLFYQVRAIKTETNPGGGIYTNNSVGPIAFLVYDPAPPALDISSTLITCLNPASDLTLTTTANATTFEWTGPNSFTSTVQNPSVMEGGDYNVTVTFADGCTSTAVHTVAEDVTMPELTGMASGSLTCTNTVVELTVTADVEINASAEWQGPNGYQANGTSVNATVAGAYTVVATAVDNGCTNVAQVFVSANTAAPLAFTTNATITCTNPSVTINGSSSIPGSTFEWTGPGGFMSSLQNPIVSVPGIYHLTATAQNGCTGTANATVTEDITPPASFNIPPQVTYNCNTPCVSLPVPPVPGYTFFLDNQQLTPGQVVMLCNAGNYTVTARLDASGCTKDYNVDVIADLAGPGVAAGSDGGQITCADPSVQLMSSSSTPGASYAWVGPNAFSSNLQNPVAENAGTYTVTATGPNGCTSTDEITIDQDGSVPTVTATGGTLTCLNATVTLMGTSNAPGSSYAWSGPAGFTSTVQNPTVSIPGLYIFESTSTNGCSASTSAQVIADLSGPVIFVPNIEPLTCVLNCVTVQATSSTPGVTIDPVEYCGPGIYSIVATNPGNGCTASVSVTVEQNITPPNIMLPTLETLDCNTLCTTIQATSNTPGVVIAPVLICDAGPFMIVATNPANGCTNSVSGNITEAPALSFDGNTTTIIDCAGNIFIGVQGAGGTPPYHYLWSTGETTPNITIPAGAPATVSVTITDEGGCSVSAGPFTITVPPAVLISSTINDESAPGALNGSIGVTVSGGIPPYTYLWSNGATTPVISNLAGGTYTVTITGANGCTTVYTDQVQTIVGTQETALFQSLSLSPNPTDGAAILKFRLPESTPVGISVYDAMGRLVWEKGVFDALEASVSIDLSGKAQGMYSVSIRVGDKVVTRKLAVLR